MYAMPRLYWIAVQDQRVTEDGVHYFLLSFSPKLWLQLWLEKNPCLCVYVTHFARLDSFYLTPLHNYWNPNMDLNWVLTEILEIWYEKCSAKTRLNFETRILPNTITIQSWFIVGVNYQLPLVSGHYIKSKDANRSKLRDLTALLH